MSATNLVVDNKIPAGEYSRRAILWMQEHLAFALDPAAEAAESALESTGDALLSLPPPALIAIIAAAAYGLHRDWKAPALAAGALLFILNQGYWRETMKTLACVTWAAGLCMAVGVPAGIWCARHPRAYRLWARPALDMMQTLPTFVYLIPMLALFGLGYAPGLVATAIFASPAVVRMTCLGVSGVPKSLTEAGAAFGLTRRQRLWLIQLPLATPSILAGLTQCVMLSLSMVVIAALVGTPGLGVPVVRALNTGPRGVALGFESGLCIVVLAILIDRLCRPPAKKRGWAGPDGDAAAA